MDRTPERPGREAVTFAIASDENNGLLRSPRRSQRVKKNPSVTPKRFTKFFTPRPRNAQLATKASRRILQDLSAARLNSRADAASQLELPTIQYDGRASKKRKLSFTSIASLPSSPIKKSRDQEDEDRGSTGDVVTADGVNQACYDSDEEEEDEPCVPIASRPRIIPYRSISSSTSLLSRQLGGKWKTVEPNDSALWQHETAHFYSSPEDFCYYHNSVQRFSSLPFCVTSFKRTSLVAVGDEDGHVRVHPTFDNNDHLKYDKIVKSWRPHDNAIMDLEISSDDKLLATASGDQTCHIYNIDQGVSVYNLLGHTGSVKRIQFQPGSNNQMVATCSRDGNVFLWDLRSPDIGGPTSRVKLERLSWDVWSSTVQISPVNEIYDAHTSLDRLKRPKGKRQPGVISARPDYAITTCAFICESRPHLLATASENDAIIKLWDMRTSYADRAGRPIPVSATLEPKSHENHRQFGITSMSMSTDGSRLYAACRDHTIYAYSTAHLLLGGSPEMSASSSRPSKPSRAARQGLGPLYGFRHPSLSIASFYDKLAVRPDVCNTGQRSETTEMIAIGSGHECAVIFPTNERYLNEASEQHCTSIEPGLTRTKSGGQSAFKAATGDVDNLPVYYNGTALVGGHKKEVTAVAWSADGNLVTVADDHTSRCWRQNPEKARALRLNKDRDMVRHNSGWAEVQPGFDDDDD